MMVKDLVGLVKGGKFKISILLKYLCRLYLDDLEVIVLVFYNLVRKIMNILKFMTKVFLIYWKSFIVIFWKFKGNIRSLILVFY